MTNVLFTKENVMKCICGKCPVQVKSQCSKEHMEKAKKMMVTGGMPVPKEIPGLYCSGGSARCKDLDFKQMCICSMCPIWTEYRLANGEPSGYYCRDGKTR
ncbi:MAG: DUF2769 domain-containing protein [archaeon]